MAKRTRNRLPSDLPRQRVLHAFERLGFVFDREGSRHTVYEHSQDRSRSVQIRRHSRASRMLLRGVLRGLGISEAEFMKHY